MKTSRKLLPLLLTLLMLVGLLPTAALADDPEQAADITAYVSISNAGSFVRDKTGKDVVCVPVTVSDRNADGKLDIDETLYAAHEQLFDGGAAAGYSTDTGSYGLSLSKLWGDASGNFEYQLNGGSVSVMGLTDPVSAGDHLDAYITQSVYPDNEAYAAFTAYTAAALSGENVTFTLKSASYDPQTWELVMHPLAGAALTVDGAATQAVTDENGQASVSFSTGGTHIVSAVMTKTVEEKTVTAITAPACVVTVTAPVTVTVNAAPSTVSVSFFADAAADAAVDAASIEDLGVVKVGSVNFHQYALTVMPGTYSYRGTDGDCTLGGEPFTVSADPAQTVNLLRVNVRYNGAALNAEGDYTFTLKNGENDVVCGTPYVSSNIRYTPALLIAGTAHSGTVTLAEKWLEDYYTTNSGAFSTTPSKTAGSAANVNLPISAYKMIRVTVPSDAQTAFYKQNKNFNVSPVTPDARSSADGMTSYLFKSTAAHSSYTYRVSKAGEVTQAGYLKDGDDLTVSFPEEGSPESTLGSLNYDDNGVLLNLNAQNELSLRVGETFKLRAYRAPWEIINTSTGNIMVEPDFHSLLLSGSDVVSIVPTTQSSVEGNCNGNASGNWMNVTALKQGTAIVAVYYDALDVYAANPADASGITTFGAADPARWGVFVVNVDDDSSVTWNPVSHDGDWDAEFDTVYYTGDTGCFAFKPSEAVTAVTVQNVYGTTLGAARTVAAEADGSYAVPVTTGANVIAVTTADGSDYQIVRAKKISYTITNNTTGESAVNAAPAIRTEDSVTISFDKLDLPVPKMSGIYNPGYLGTAKTAYELNGSMLLTSAGTQYDFSVKNSITFTAHVAGENRLKGYISLSSMGSEFGVHRSITDEGVPANLNAAEVFGAFGVLPDISFTVADSGAKASYEDATKISKFSVVAGLSTYNMAFNWNKAQDTEAAWNKTAAQVSTFGLIANVTANDYNNVITFRYWYDGETVNSVQLQSGIATTISHTEFALNPDKLLHLQIEIRPADETLGAPITYNYLAFPGSSSAPLSYVHPFLKSLSAAAEGETLVLKPEINTVDTAYTLCVGDAETIDLSAVQLVGLYNTANTGDQSDEVTLTKMKDGSAVGEPVTVLSSGLANNPNRNWSCSGLDISDADALRITVTSYVDNATARTYTFTLDRITGSENEKKAQAVDALIDAIGEVTPDSEAAIKAAREAYRALTAEQQTLVTKLGTLTDAEAALAELKKPPLPPVVDGDDDTITVTFRLIGSTKASSDVELRKGTEGYNGAKYVTWIKTATYTLDKGATVGDLFATALDDAGLAYTGLENNYISAITAPEVCGGYVLSEMDNGLNSGWMYTINGTHPGLGLNDRVLSNGDRVIWHYVDDYSYEVRDLPDGSSGDSSLWSRWLSAADVTPAAPAPADPLSEGTAAQPEKAAFTDVPANEYYTDAVAWAVSNGITAGVDETHFAPEALCDRAQTVTFLWRAAGCPEPTHTDNPFTDVRESDYFFKAVLWAAETGITKGSSAATFSPTQPVTRAQVVTFLYRFAKGSSAGSNPFTDVKDDAFYAEAVNWAVAQKITNGTSADTFSPDAVCIRAQIVTFLFRYFA